MEDLSVDDPQPRSGIEEPNNYLPWADLRKFFLCAREVNKEAKNFTVVCLTCKKSLSASKTSSSNLKKHLEVSHATEFKIYREEKNARAETGVGEPPSKRPKGELRQLRMSDFLTDKDRKSDFVTQKRVDDVVVDLIVNEGLPFELVNSPYFRSCVLLGLPDRLSVMSNKKLSSTISNSYTNMKKSLHAVLAEAQYVATTADCWSKFRKSFLGMTVHWIDQDSLERRSAALALRRIYGKHSYQKLAEEINSVHQEYHIRNKVVKTSTDNGSNFCKAFREYFSDFCEKEETSSTEEANSDEDEIIPVNDFLNSPDEDDDIILPPQQRCASHTLCLVAVTDAKIALNNAKYKRCHDAAFSKLKKIWTKQNKSSLVADAIQKICGVYLKTPSPTRWNGLRDAVHHALDLSKKRTNKDDESPLTKAFDAAGVDRLTDVDLAFLSEYDAVAGPLAKALDILQGEKEMYLGFLLPTLTQLRKEIEEVKSTGLVYCEPLAKAVLDGLDRRFAHDFTDPSCIIAACSLPQFQFDWIESEQEEDHARDLLLKALQEVAEKDSMTAAPSADSAAAIADASPGNTGAGGCANSTGTFFKFKQRRGAPMKPSDLARDELTRFQASTDTTVQSLHQFPLMKKVFVKYNTALPSSASVERLFSTGGNTFTIKRSRLADETLEMQVLLKANKNIVSVI